MLKAKEGAEARVVLCTVPDNGTAEKLARQLVEEGLAACCNIVPGLKSVYRWQGKIEQDDEQLLIIKTTAAVYDALQAQIVRLHPYETPEILSLRVDRGLQEYLMWMEQNTGAGNAKFAARNTK